MTAKKQIIIYQDEGAEQNCVDETVASFKKHFAETTLIKTLSANEIQQTAWENETLFFIMPGGRSLPFYSALGEKGNQKIIRYVENGGVYIGFCAGAYYACALTEFEKGQPLEVLCEGPLNFFSGAARGPVYGLNQFHYENYQGARIAQIECESGEVFPVYFNGGPEFVDAENYPQVKVLARYADIARKPPAIIECQFGKGRAFLSAVHPEFSCRGVNKTKKNAQATWEKLDAIEIQRLQLLTYLFKKISQN